MSETTYLSWSDFKTAVLNKKKVRWFDKDTFYKVLYFDDIGVFETSVVKDSGADQTDFETNYKSQGNVNFEAERDANNTLISRSKITTTGWHFQLHTIGIKTSTWNGFFNKSINPATLVESDLGFVIFKLFDSSRVEITDPADANLAAYTQVDWAVSHEMGILGALFTQASAPVSDVRMYTVGAPGILNVPFGTGGINLKLVGTTGNVDADGRAEKYLHPSIPMAGLNKFRTIFVHSVGFVHECQLSYRLFKPTT